MVAALASLRMELSKIGLITKSAWTGGAVVSSVRSAAHAKQQACAAERGRRDGSAIMGRICYSQEVMLAPPPCSRLFREQYRAVGSARQTFQSEYLRKAPIEANMAGQNSRSGQLNIRLWR